MTPILNLLHRYARGWYILALLVAFLLVQIFGTVPFDRLTETTGYPPFDLRTAYTPDEVYQTLDAYGPAGRSDYIGLLLTIDLAFPFISGALFALITTYLFRRAFSPNHIAQPLVLVPLLVMLADYLENICNIIVVLAYPTRLDLLARAASLFTTLKMILSPVELLLILVGLIGLFFAWMSKRLDPARRS